MTILKFLNFSTSLLILILFAIFKINWLIIYLTSTKIHFILLLASFLITLICYFLLIFILLITKTRLKDYLIFCLIYLNYLLIILILFLYFFVSCRLYLNSKHNATSSYLSIWTLKYFQLRFYYLRSYNHPHLCPIFLLSCAWCLQFAIISF